LPSRNVEENAKRLGFQFAPAAFEIHFKKRLTIELTWGETANTQL
jgi:hypothetical protein